MALKTNIDLRLDAVLSSTLDLASGSVPLAIHESYRLTDGTGSNQANRIFHDRRTLAASANEDLDLAGSLTDAFGATITFARIKAIMVKAAATNTNNVLVGGDATSTFFTWVGAETDLVVVRPGGLFLLATPDSTGYAVTATTGDLLRVANSSSGTSVTYDIVLVGAAT